MTWLLKATHQEEARKSYGAWLRSYCYGGGADPPRVNLQTLRQQIGGVAARLYLYAAGDIGRVMNTYSPEVDLLDCIDRNHIVYVMLPSLDKGEAAVAFAKLFFSDFRAALASLYKRPAWQRPRVPFLVTLDEFGSYANRLAASTLEMARGARVGLMPMFQTYANLRNVSEEFADQIVGNAEVSTFFCAGDTHTAEFAARLFGEARRGFAAHSTSEVRSAFNQNLALRLFYPTGHSESRSLSVREAYDYRVRPEALMQLAPGQALVRVKSANRAFKLRVPMIMPPHGPGFTCTRYCVPVRKGLDFMKRFGPEAAP
jgi:hypothetical protein